MKQLSIALFIAIALPCIMRAQGVDDARLKELRDRYDALQAQQDSLLGPIERVREAGVRIAIDDTGSGYATLSALLRIKPDIIKLDRDLVRGIDQDPVRRAMARALVQFTREDGPADLVAEGIETQAEATALVDLGVTLGQGYLFGRPMPVSELPETTAWHPERKGRSETS